MTDPKTPEQRSEDRVESVANWLLAAIADADSTLQLTRTNHGRLSIEVPDGRVFSVQVEEVPRD